MTSSGSLARTCPTTLAGDPATMVRALTGFNTKLPALIIDPRSILMFPSTVLCAPIKTCDSTFGCLSPVAFPVPPRVTPCKMLTESPITHVSPMTTPVP